MAENNQTLSLLHMLKRTMQKKPKIVAAKFHEVFNTRFQLALIGALLGMIAVKLTGIS